MWHSETQNILLTIANQPSCFCICAQMQKINVLLTLPQVCSIWPTVKIPEWSVAMIEGRVKGSEIFGRSTIQHITGHFSFFLVPGCVTHCPPATISMHLHSPRASVQTTCQSQSLVFFIKMREQTYNDKKKSQNHFNTYNTLMLPSTQTSSDLFNTTFWP